MQDHDWNDLKYALALGRTGRLARAATMTGVSETTAARRIRALESKLGTPLFVRGASGHFEATDAGLAVIERAEAIEQENLALRESLGRMAAGLSGVVRVSSVPIIINRILVPAVPDLRRSHPDLAVELVPESRNVDLSRREADLAVRFSRPQTGGLQTKARRIGELAFAIYASAAVPSDQSENLPWVGYDDAHQSLPQAKWLRAEANAGGEAGLRVADAETAIEAAAHGIGRTILPALVGDADGRLRRLPARARPGPPTRDVWMLFHADQSGRASLDAVKDWLAGLGWAAA